jgi:hypothetical protein
MQLEFGVGFTDLDDEGAERQAEELRDAFLTAAGATRTRSWLL